MIKTVAYFLFLMTVLYGISSLIKFLINKDIAKLKKNLLIDGIAIILLSPFVVHYTLLATSSGYNKMLDQRVYSSLVENLTPYHIDKLYIDTRDVVNIPFYDVNILRGISYHSTSMEQINKSGDHEYLLITIRLNNDHRSIILSAVDDHSDIYRISYRDRTFHVLIPKLREVLVEKLQEADQE